MCSYDGQFAGLDRLERHHRRYEGDTDTFLDRHPDCLSVAQRHDPIQMIEAQIVPLESLPKRVERS
jgi:hypothetical protein